MKISFSKEYFEKMFKHIKENKLKIEDIAVVVGISFKVNKDNQVRFGTLELARYVGMDIDKLQESLKRLCAVEYIDITETPCTNAITVNPRLLGNWNDVSPSSQYPFDEKIRESCASDDW